MTFNLTLSIDVMEISGVLAFVYKKHLGQAFIQYLLPHFAATL